MDLDKYHPLKSRNLQTNMIYALVAFIVAIPLVMLTQWNDTAVYVLEQSREWQDSTMIIAAKIPFLEAIVGSDGAVAAMLTAAVALIASPFIALATFASLVLLDIVAYLSNRRRNA